MIGRDLPLVVFSDDPGLGTVAIEREENGRTVVVQVARRALRAEQKAAAFWLANRRGRRASPPWGGHNLPPDRDVEGTCEEIERAAGGVPVMYRAPMLVWLGWGKGPRALRDQAPGRGAPWLERAGLPTVVPAVLTHGLLDGHGRIFRDELVRRGLIPVAGGGTDPATLPETARFVSAELPVHGWKSIGAVMAMGERTARRRADDSGMPVYRAAGRQPWAFPSELKAWLAGSAPPPENEPCPHLARDGSEEGG